MEAELVNILERHVGLEMAQEGFFQFMMANEEDRLSFAMRYKDTNKEIRDQLEDMGKIDPVEQYNDSMDQLVAKADSLNLMVEQMFKPIELQFEAQFSQMDLNDARQELADLNQEEVDLMADNIAINEEILELKEKELLTDEEILEQQELLNEALKIEQRIEQGKFLTDNQSLRKEKLKKDLRRVELAAAQGSLEFADKEIGAIKENIALIDAKAVSAEDAEKLRDKAEEIAQNAQVRRQEEIIELEERRIENNERLTEIPDDIVRANFKVLESQKDLILANTELFTSFEELGNVSETQAKRMAAALGIPYNIVKEMESLFTTGATAADYINKFLPEGFQTNFVPNIPPTRKSLKINSAQDFMNSPYAERGHGSFSSGGAVTNNNHLEVTATTIPSSDLAQRKFVKEISREMEKLGLGGFR